MKIFWSILLAVFTLLCGLFVFQNQSRTLSIDTNGYQLSFDLGVWGIAASELSFVVFVTVTFVIGIFVGLLLPTIVKGLLK